MRGQAALAVVLCGCLAVPCAAAERKRLDPAGFALRRETLTSEDCSRIYLQLIENFVGWADGRFRASDAYEKGGGYFRAAGSGVDWARGNSNLAIAYAVLLTSQPERTHFTIHRIPRERLEDQLRKTIRFLCLSYRAPKAKGRPRWRPGWQVSLDFIGIAWAAHLFEKRLDAGTVALVKKVTCDVADSLDKGIPSRRFGDTGSEDCTWNAPMLAFAANKYPDDPRAEKWDRLCKKWALNALSTGADKTSEKMVDGRPLKAWIVSENVHPDLTVENHNMWSVGYQVQCQFWAEGELAYRLFGRRPPEAFAHHADEMWRGVTRALYLWDGDILYPTGQDWNWKSYSASEYLCWQRLFRRNAAAGAYEGRAIQTALKRQLAVGTGALGYSNFGNNTVKPKRWAFSYLCHQHVESPKPVSMQEADREGHGVYLFRHVGAAIHRAPTKCVSVSWHKRFQPIYVIPEGDSTFDDPPFFVPYDRRAGGVTVSRLSAAKAPGETKREAVKWGQVRLIEATQTHDGRGMRIVYARSDKGGLTEYVAVVSLPEEATVCITAFRAGEAGTWVVGRPFACRVGSIQGLPMRIETHRGDRWLNWTDHLAFVSTEPLPKDLQDGRFYAADDRAFAVNAGEWFGRTAVVVYTRQPHDETAKMAEHVRFLNESADGRIALRLRSSSGDTALRLEFPK